MIFKQSRIIEREKYINQVPSIISNLKDGNGLVISITGETGIGKTRLSQEIAKIASHRGCNVIQGRSYSVASDTAYSSIIEMINTSLRGINSEKILSWTKDLPDLGKLFPRFQLPEPPHTDDPSLEKTRLFESMICLIERMAEGHPLVIIQEDLHFADPASLEFIHYLSRGITISPAILVVTIDTMELSNHPYVNSFMQSLRKEEFVKEFQLSQLSEIGVAQLLKEQMGDNFPEELVPLIMNHSEGIPLFIDELLHSFLETGVLSKQNDAWILSSHSLGAIPNRIKELIKNRIHRITPKDHKLMLYISISKGTVSHAILSLLTQMTEEDFLEAIQRLKVSGLLYEEVHELDVHYGIHHMLVKEVMLEEFPIMVVRRAYQAFIEVIENIGYDDSENLAHLYYGAGPEADQARTIQVFMKEANRAFSLAAYASANHYYKSALQLIQTYKLDEKEHIPFLLQRLGEAHRMLGERSEAQQYCLEAIRRYMQFNNQKEIARLHGVLSLILWESGELDQSLQYLEDGLTIARGQKEFSAVRYELLHTSLMFLSRLKRPEEYCQIYEEIQEVYKLVGTPQAAAKAKVAEIDYWTSCMYKENYKPENVQALIEGLSNMEVEDEALFRGYFLSSISFVMCGQYELSRRYSQKALETAKRMRVLEYEVRSYWIQVFADLQSGNWKLTLPKVELIFSKARRMDVGRPLIYAYITKSMVLAWMGKYTESQLCLEEMKQSFPSFPTKDGHIADMLSPTEMMIAIGTTNAADYYISMKRRPFFVAFPFLNLALWGEVELAAGEVNAALDTMKELLFGNPEENLYAWALGKRLSSKINFTLGNRNSSITDIKESIQYFERLNMPLDQARSLLFYAGMLLEDQQEEAKKHVLHSLEVFERLEAETDLHLAQSFMKKLGLRLPKPTTRYSSKRESLLSKRELEVARLVAEGLTNIEIGKALIISPRTVSTHLEKIYRRLEINSRAALVKYLMEEEEL